ncbi:MAG: hypothetical protein AAFO07_22625 [Bacteroidota bacterium]
MKPFQINMINALVLIAMGLWGYFSAVDPSPTAFIPVGFGVVFLLLTPSFRKENKAVAHIVVLLTLLLIIALFMPLKGALGRNDTTAIVRVGLMLATSVIAMIIYVRSFIAARKAKA